MRSRIGRRLLIGAGLGAIVAAGCRRWNDATSPEPSGGRWRPLLIDPANLIRLPPPPPRGSAAETSELNELVDLSRKQDGRKLVDGDVWEAGAMVRWSEIARDLVAHHRTPPPLASRVYALLGVASYDSLITVWHNKYLHNRPSPSSLTSALAPKGKVAADPSYPSAQAAVAAACSRVLSFLYPDEAPSLTTRAAAHQDWCLAAGLHFRSDLLAGASLGRSVAAQVVERARGDGADAVWEEPLQAGPGLWRCADSARPEGPVWGRVTPWVIEAVADFRAPPPPSFQSPAFRAALAEVKRYSDTRTSEQERIVALWADGPGSYTPPGRWNRIAGVLILKYQLNELRAARTMALLNTAMMDAGIACYDSKYRYLLIRPFQADPTITTPVGQPNHPSYPSAHAAFSGAAAALLSRLFPAEAGTLLASAEQATLSRLLGGIHYRFDGEAGLAQGRAIARRALERASRDGSS